MKFIHLSDLHIHTDNRDNKNTIGMFNFISANYKDHKLIVTGDIADDGATEQFGNAYKMLSPFKGKVFVCPGNHDFGAMGNLYSYERAVHFDDIIAKQLNQGGTFKGDSTPVVNVLREGNIAIMLIALDSNLETVLPLDFACGEIGELQLDALNTILSTQPASGITKLVKIVFFHHHPFIHHDPTMILKDARELGNILYNRVDVVLFGHKHVVGEWQGPYNAKYVLASDNSPDQKTAKEITVDQKGISVASIQIK